MNAPGYRRSDGTELAIVPGFRERVLAMPRTPVRPTDDWDDDDFRAAAAERIRRIRRLVTRAARQALDLRGVRALEIGCGPGIDAMLLAMLAPGSEIVGIDLDVPPTPGGDTPALRRLAEECLAQLGDASIADRVPVRLEAMNATAMSFDDQSFDFCWSDAVLEHVKPFDGCMAETWRVLRPGALAYHKIDPYYWLKGCHRKGLVDMPWAHARLDPDEVVEVARLYHGRRQSERCAARLAELNRWTLREWEEAIDASDFEVVSWNAARSEFAERMLQEFPGVGRTLLARVGRDDLVHSAITVWLRR